MTFWLAALLLALAATAGAEDGTLRAEGLAWVRGIETRGQPSWLEGGFGRLTEGAAGAHDSATLLRGQFQLGLDWKPSPVVLLHLHGLARKEGPGDRGSSGGLAEAFLQCRPELSPTLAARFRVGMFFPQTSRENVGPLWSSPYTLTLSALNSWIGEELRLTGLESALVYRAPSGSELQLAGTAFGANDTLGALAAWRGWSLGDRLTTVGETLPLPPLFSFGPGRGFAGQQISGTSPVAELDERIGWQARARWLRPDSVLLQASYLDNRGDRELHRGQYAWRTRFAQAGGELHLGRHGILIGEAAMGDTGMGPAGAAHVDVRFRVGYLLASWGSDRARLSARYDRFRNQDRDGTAEPDQESGSAWTLAALWRPVHHLRLGAELVDLRSQRPAAAASGASPDTDARRVIAELRLLF